MHTMLYFTMYTTWYCMYVCPCQDCQMTEVSVWQLT